MAEESGGKVIAWPQEGLVNIIYPAPDQADLARLGEQLVPSGLPFLILDISDLPPAEYRSAMRGDFSDPDGVGKAT